MAYTFKDPISLIPDDLGLVRTAKMIRDTREYNRFDTDNLYSMLNTAQVAPGDEWIINDLHQKVDANLGDVVKSGKFFGATNAVAQSVSALKNSKGLKLASQSYAAYKQGQETEKKIMSQNGGALNFSEKAWQSHSSYYQDENGKWIDNVFVPQVEKEENYNAEMITLIGRLNADSGAIDFKKHKINPGDIRDFMYNPKGISKSKAKRIALSLVDAYTNGHIGDQDLRKLTQLELDPETGENYTTEAAMDNISQRLVDIASRQTYWQNSISQLPQGKTKSSSSTPPPSQGMWTPVQGSAINSGLSWNSVDDFSVKKIDNIRSVNVKTDNPAADLNVNSSARSTLAALRQQENLIVNNYGTEEQIVEYNKMAEAFYNHNELKDLVQHLSMNTNSFNEVPTGGEGSREYKNIRSFLVPQGTEQGALVLQLFGGNEKGTTLSTRGSSASGPGTSNEMAIQDLNNTLGTDYVVEDIPMLEDLVRNYFKYQVETGDSLDELMESRGTEMSTQLTGYSVNTMMDENGTLGDINKMLTQSTLNQFTIDGVITDSDEYKEIMDKILTTNQQGDVTKGHSLKFKQITQPGISTGTPSRFMLELGPGEVYTLTENYGMEREFGGGFTYSVLNTMTGQNPLIISQEASAKNVQRKIASGEYQLTGDGSIRSKDYLTEIAPILKQNISNMFIQKVSSTQGYSPDFSQFSEEEKNAYLSYEETQLNNYREKVMKKLVFAAHMQLMESSSRDVPLAYMGVADVAQLMRILETDYDYLLLLQNYGLELPSSLITDVTGL